MTPRRPSTPPPTPGRPVMPWSPRPSRGSTGAGATPTGWARDGHALRRGPRPSGPTGPGGRSCSPSTTTRASPGRSPATSAGATAPTTGSCGPTPARRRCEAIREVTLKGEQVAAILADYRMPRMNGVDFLEAAMDLVPQARRALLTAYADTNAAIAAINVVDVDHYLLKPWEPPEEKLYPVVDELLATWQREGKPPEHEIKILGHPWSAAVVRGARLPGPQPGLVPLAQRRGARRAPAAGRGRGRRHPGPGGDHHRRPGPGPARAWSTWPTRSACPPRRPGSSTTS